MSGCLVLATSSLASPSGTPPATSHQGMQVVKMFAWESSASRRIKEPREKELGAALKFVYAATGVMSSIWVASMLMSLASFVAFYWSGHDLSSDVVFPCLYLFENLTFPLLEIPMSLATVAGANTSFRRIAVRFCVHTP